MKVIYNDLNICIVELPISSFGYESILQVCENKKHLSTMQLDRELTKGDNTALLKSNISSTGAKHASESYLENETFKTLENNSKNEEFRKSLTKILNTSCEYKQKGRGVFNITRCIDPRTLHQKIKEFETQTLAKKKRK